MEKISSHGILFSRFLLVGMINTIIGLTTMYLLLYIGLSYWPATFVGNLLGACSSFLLNRTYTFQSDKSMQSTAYRFVIVIGVCYLGAYFIGKNVSIWAMNQLNTFPGIYTEEIAVLIGTVLYTLLNYIGQKRFVFNK